MTPSEQGIPTTPADIFERTEVEGRRRLMASPLAQISTGFTAGFNIVFAIVALGITHHLVSERFGTSVGQLAGALAFGIGLTFVVVGRSELFTENFLGPITARRAPDVDRFAARLARLWGLTLVFNLVGGVVLALILTTGGALPEGSPGALVEVAERIERREPWPDFMNAIAGGALVTLLSWLVLSVGSAFGRFTVAWAVGSLLALGPFNHVVVSVLQLFFGLRYDAQYGYGAVFEVFAIGTAGNLIGGVLFVTLVRAGQARE
ncbi:MAG: formate/nitrite transporter family protein [Actinomycetota bacterium]|nr:formate/nitrite transporter family protein [Actinomycetota bacterium]